MRIVRVAFLRAFERTKCTSRPQREIHFCIFPSEIQKNTKLFPLLEGKYCVCYTAVNIKQNFPREKAFLAVFSRGIFLVFPGVAVSLACARKNDF